MKIFPHNFYYYSFYDHIFKFSSLAYMLAFSFSFYSWWSTGVVHCVKGILVEVSIFNRCPDDTVLWQKYLLSPFLSFFLFLSRTTYIKVMSISKSRVFSPQYKEPMAFLVFYAFLDMHGIFCLVGRDYSDSSLSWCNSVYALNGTASQVLAF